MSVSLLKHGWKEQDLFVIGKFNEDGELQGFCYAGRPSTLRVYDGENELKNGLNYMRRNRNCTLKGIKILTGEIIEEETK